MVLLPSKLFQNYNLCFLANFLNLFYYFQVINFTSIFFQKLIIFIVKLSEYLLFRFQIINLFIYSEFHDFILLLLSQANFFRLILIAFFLLIFFEVLSHHEYF